MQSKGILKNISWLGAASILVKPIWFGFNVILCVNILGAFNYGILTSTLSLAVLTSLFTDLGTIRYSVREIAKDRSSASRYFSNIMLLRLVLSFGAWLLALSLGTLLGYEGPAFIALIFASIYALSLNITNFNRAIFQAHENLKLEAVFLLIEKLLVVGLGTACLLWTRKPEWTLAGMAAGMMIVTIINASWISKNVARLDKARLDWQFIKRTVVYSLPLGAAGIFAVLYYRTDAVMIEYMLGETPTGQYGVAFRILDASILLPTVIVAGLFARFSSYWHEEKFAEFRKLSQSGIAGLLLLSLPIAAFCTIYAELIIGLIAPDPSFEASIPVLALIVWTFPMNCIYLLLSAALTAMNEQKYLAIVSGIAFLLNLAMNLVLIPKEGITGAALTTVITAFFLTIAVVGKYIQTTRSVRPTGLA
ncbi:MAG: flippase [Rhodothermales bacterium]